MADLEHDHTATTAALSPSSLSLVQRSCLAVAKESCLERGNSGWRRAFTSRAARGFSAGTVQSLVKLGLLEKSSQGRMFCTEAGKQELGRPMASPQARRPAQLQQLDAADAARLARQDRRAADQPLNLRLPYADN